MKIQKIVGYLCTITLSILISIAAIYAQKTTTERVPEYEKWIGEKIIFLSQPPEHQKYSYREYSSSYPDDYQIYSSSYQYQELVGKIAEIMEIKKDLRYNELIITLKIQGSNELLYASIFSSQNLDDVGLISEMDKAKKYVGKAVWNKRQDFLYTEKADIPIKNLEKLTVIKVEWGEWDSSPLRFYFKTKDGKVGWGDYSYSRITGLFHCSDPFFDKSWYLTNPYKPYPNWSQRAWKAIEKKEIYIGMTKEMVLMSWDKPEKINRDVGSWGVDEQWVYGDVYLYFRNGKLTSFQD